eukprot:scaffold29314_cov101-Isochrysis_galbana.AAC.1
MRRAAPRRRLDGGGGAGRGGRRGARRRRVCARTETGRAAGAMGDSPARVANAAALAARPEAGGCAAGCAAGCWALKLDSYRASSVVYLFVKSRSSSRDTLNAKRCCDATKNHLVPMHARATVHDVPCINDEPHCHLFLPGLLLQAFIAFFSSFCLYAARDIEHPFLRRETKRALRSMAKRKAPPTPQMTPSPKPSPM